MRARELLAKNVIAIRLERKMSLAGLVKASGLSKEWIRVICRAEHSTGVDILDVLAGALGVTVAELFTDPPRAEPPPLKRGRKKKEG